MARARALMVFQVSAAGMRLRVRLLPSVADVDAEYRGGRRRSDRKVVHGYFQAAAPGARVIGTVAVPLSGTNLREIVPHEVCHAVIHHLQGVSARDDETAASAIGLLCAAIFSRIEAFAAFQETP
ncbi:SprT-like domain-containing protein [Achromobacter insuavis]|uniref:SprT-like domain-containing protein n=1 Tax=Achromobacter insuavis TaxID=1287735 RepID=UPI001F132B1C|nr:SprT-like domain-containing protein [Achromobacter insuavis]